MIGYLLDTSAIWEILRNREVGPIWRGPSTVGGLYVCEPTRSEFLFSALGPADRDDLAETLDGLCGLVPVPKTAWRWVDAAQYKLTQRGQHRGPGVVDLVVCATAVHHGLTILHNDRDFKTVARTIAEVSERNILK